MEQQRTGSRYPQGSESDPFFDLLPSSNTAYSEVPPETRKNVDSSLGDIEYASGGPSYDFQPGRGLRKRNAGSNGGGSNSARKDDELPTPRREVPMRTPPDEILYPGMSGPSEPVWSAPSNERPQFDEPPRLDEDTVAAVERTMKKYGDNLMRVLEGLSGRLQRLEGSTGRLESAVSQLQQQGNNRHGETDGALRSLTNDIHEIQRSVQTLRDRQEIAEAQAELVKLQAGIMAPPKATSEPAPGPASTPPPPPVPVPVPVQMLPSAPVQGDSSDLPPAAPSAPVMPPPSPELVSQHPTPLPPPAPAPPVPQQHVEGGYPPPAYHHHPPPSSHPPAYQHQPPPAMYTQEQARPAPPMQYQPPPMPPHISQQAQYGQGPSPPPRESVQYGGGYGTPQVSQYQQLAYESPREGPGTQLALPAPPGYVPQGPPPAMYEGGSQGGMYPMPPQPYQVAQPVTSAPSSAGSGSGGGGGGGYPRLQLAQPVQQRPGPPPSPSVQGVEAGPGGSPLTSSKVPIDKVIEDVSAMGFTREQVRSVVRKLTENGQAVDLNVVLDKLMNGGGAGDQKKWFGR